MILRTLFLFLFLLTIQQSKGQNKSQLELNKQVKNVVSRYPVPDVPDLLFYLQRNKNANTVVYQANILPDGKLDPEKPVSVYWIRYSEDSSRKELNWIQRWLAYGIEHEQAKDGSDYFYLTPVALRNRKIMLSLNEQGRPVATLSLNGKMTQLERIYAMAEETGWLPLVQFIQLKGKDLQTRQVVYEYLFPKQNKLKR
jgi:hypothetical protein